MKRLNYPRRISSGGKKAVIQNRSGFGRYDPSKRKQFAVVKMRYGMKAASHRKFLEQYMPQKNKPEVTVKPERFGTAGYEERMTGKHFKFIISPESDRVPMKKLVEAWIAAAELDSGYTLDWQAVIHTDTGHPHAHILINGRDLHGENVKFDRDFVKRRSHQAAADIVTAMIGERTAEQIRLSGERSITADRWTGHDEKIKRLCTRNGGTGFPEVNAVTEELSLRLRHLQDLKLAVYNGRKRTYRLEKNWEETLRAAGRYNSFLAVRDELLWTVPSDMELYTDTTGPVSGEVRKIYTMNDEDVWNNALVIENRQLHRAWYVPLYNPEYRKLEGTEISVSMTHNSKGLLVPVITKGGSRPVSSGRNTQGYMS